MIIKIFLIFNFIIQIKFIVFFDSNNIFSNLLIIILIIWIIILNISDSSLSWYDKHIRSIFVGSDKLVRPAVIGSDQHVRPTLVRFGKNIKLIFFSLIFFYLSTLLKNYTDHLKFQSCIWTFSIKEKDKRSSQSKC
jgi:hypothetical protein